MLVTREHGRDDGTLLGTSTKGCVRVLDLATTAVMVSTIAAYLEPRTRTQHRRFFV